MMADEASNRIVLITGASAGLGDAFARAFAARGRHLALVARRVDRLETLAATLARQYGTRSLVIGCDLGRYGAEAEVLGAVDAAGLQVETLVNNAGYSIPQSFAAVSWAAQRDFLMTLVVSACGLAHGVLPSMIERQRGSIINVASLAGFAPGAAGHSLYPGAKSLMIKFSQSLDAEYRSKGVRVTVVCPGFTRTEFAAANGTQGIMDASPRLFFMTASQVVEATIAANAEGRVVVTPGWHNKVAAVLLQYLPQAWVSAAVRAGARRYHLGGEVA
jgi:hypothetical protein